MKDVVLSRFERADGQERVSIVKRAAGTFGYTFERRVPVYDADLAQRLNDHSTAWVPARQETATVCGTAAEAEKEARGAISWLNESNLCREVSP